MPLTHPDDWESSRRAGHGTGRGLPTGTLKVELVEAWEELARALKERFEALEEMDSSQTAVIELLYSRIRTLENILGASQQVWWCEHHEAVSSDGRYCDFSPDGLSCSIIASRLLKLGGLPGLLIGTTEGEEE